MRELKFRAWHLIEARWAMESEIESIILVNTFYHGGRFELDEKSGNGLAKDLGSTLEVMQYTGLKDSGGKEIYEGDLFKIEGNWPVYAVVYDEQTASFGLKSPHGPFYAFSKLHDRNEVFIMVGNIHEHPHLLKEASL